MRAKIHPLRGSSIDIHPNARWQQNGITVAGGNRQGNGINQLSDPLGLYVDDDQTVYVADQSNHRIVEWKRVYPLRGSSIDIHPNARWQQDGITVAGGNRQGNETNQLSNPLGLYVDDDQTIYVADELNHRIVEWKRGATSGQVVAGGNGRGSVLGLLVLISLCQSMTLSRIRRQPQHDPDADFNITQLIQSKGYPCEEHKVITKDGYILGVFRIPHGRKSSSPGRPVLLQHGLIDSAATWVMNFPDQSLGFMLADAGYDVWLGNVRGNYYSRAHVKYNPDHDTEFWNFSWDDMARDDLPSMIYYILNVTQQTQISYVGHSQGTLIGFAQFGGLSNIVQNNVSFFGALAPVAHITHIKSPLKHLFNTLMGPESFWHLLFGNKEFLASSNSIKWLAKHACGNVILNPLICENVLFILCGPDNKNLNATRTEVYISHEPDGTSVKNMIHFAQMFLSKQFQAYDYGSADKNRLHYNQTTPPIYSIRPMKVPTAIFSSGEDWLADPEDVAFILDNIQNLVYKKYIPDYNHLDFVWALTANKVIYQDLINQMQKYHPSK
ncbi:unnamed protein product [Rotaria sp. Silwood1]|nr:unnamed protein product [Rotaria sp. Silwood1]